MLAYILRRLLQFIPLLFLASVAIYALVALQPGDPLDEVRRANPRMTAEQYQALRQAYGLDDPIYIRYFKWLGRAVQGDLGYSRTYGIPAAEFVFEQRLPKTLVLSGAALLVSLLLAVPIGIYSAVRQYSLTDYTITFLSFVGFSMPVFFLGILLLYLFAIILPENLGLPRLPTGGVPALLWSDVTSGRVGFWEYIGQWAYYLILPVATLSVVQIAAWTRFMRASLLEVLQQDFVRTARSKGLPERIVLYKHALRNAIIPVITLVGLSIPGVFGGAVLTETVFSYPGMGRAVYDSLLAKDYNVAMTCLAFLAFLTAFFNLFADLLYAVADPRIRYS